MDNAAPRPTEEQLRLFSEKIGKRLIDRPPSVDPETHRERIASLLRLAGEATFYQILDVPPTATAQEIHEAYDQVARLVMELDRHGGFGGLGGHGKKGRVREQEQIVLQAGPIPTNSESP